MGQQLFHHSRRAIHDIRAREFIRVGGVPLPASWGGWQEAVGVFLTFLLVLMLCLEPILYCFSDPHSISFARHCKSGDKVVFVYSVVSSAAMLMYFLLLSDLSVLSTRVSAYALVCVRVISEVALFLSGLAFACWGQSRRVAAPCTAWARKTRRAWAISVVFW